MQWICIRFYHSTSGNAKHGCVRRNRKRCDARNGSWGTAEATGGGCGKGMALTHQVSLHPFSSREELQTLPRVPPCARGIDASSGWSSICAHRTWDRTWRDGKGDGFTFLSPHWHWDFNLLVKKTQARIP